MFEKSLRWNPILKAYIKEAIEVEKAGLEVDYKKTSEFVIPEEFRNRLDESPALKTAFDAIDAGTAKRIHPLFFCRQTIQNPGVKG